MTPEEILQAAPINGWSDRQVVSRILQWGREMCDKQKAMLLTNADCLAGVGTYGMQFLSDTPYPKELQ